VLGALALCGASAAGPACPDLLVDRSELEDMLDRTLGGLRPLVDQRAVLIDPDSKNCTLRIELATSALAPYTAACRLDACSSVLHRDKSLALREFDVSGCDPLFDVFGLSRHVPSNYVDASARMRQHCGSDGFEIASVTAVRVAGEAKLRIGFRPAAAGR
jgi:hypothetical protein